MGTQALHVSVLHKPGRMIQQSAICQANEKQVRVPISYPMGNGGITCFTMMTHPRPTHHEEGGHDVRLPSRTWRNQNSHGNFGDTDTAYSSYRDSNDHGCDPG